ncbi:MULTISPECIES: hypothetical protein [unclassified Thioalkalivibrio]|uniref:hypothetical protein n=1 Tax=unclassified Thioalkalivibrio TaxID=2621013 RepID=UPI00036A5812|nr:MULTISPECIES: hypothetical protein [unclassified Thioalkalivibrio]
MAENTPMTAQELSELADDTIRRIDSMRSLCTKIIVEGEQDNPDIPLWDLVSESFDMTKKTVAALQNGIGT